LVDEGVRLIDACRTTPGKTLIQQLSRSAAACQVSPADPALLRAADPAHESRESVVVVSGLYRCRRCAHWHAGTASGFVLAPNGIVVTNHHVVNDPDFEAIVVMTADGRVLPVVEVLAANRAQDLAILKVPADDLVAIPVAASHAAAPVGAPITVISHPDGQYFCCTAGIVSRYVRTREAGEVVDEVSITADYARGSSGAPVLNSRGQVVGIVKSTESVYYSESGQQQRDLQMVFKKCVPAHALWQLIKTTGPPDATVTADPRAGAADT
jgi:S1-C subfamily serine protease